MWPGPSDFHDALGMPLATLLVAVGVAALAFEVWLLVIARRRLARRERLQREAVAGDWAPVLALDGAPSRWLELCAPVAPLVVLGVTALSVQRSRGLVLRVLEVVEAPGENAQLIASGLHGEPTAVVIGTLGAWLPTVLACIVVGLAVSARVGTEGLLHGAALRTRDAAASAVFAAHPGPRAALVVATAVGLVLLSLLPVSWAVLATALDKLRLFALLAELEPDAQRSALESSALAAQGTLARGFRVSVAGTLLAAVALGALLWRTAPTRARGLALGPAAPAPSARGDMWIAASALALAVVSVVLAAPMKRESELPWPPGNLHGLGLGRLPPHERSTRAVQLEGPDAMGGGPLVEVTEDEIAVDRVRLSAAGLEPRLQELRRQYGVLHSGEAFPGALRLVCSPDTLSKRVFQLLATLARAGYREPTFVFETRRSVERPVLGTVELRHVTGARVRLVDAAALARPGAVLVHAHDTSTCQELSERVAGARLRGLEVALPLELSPVAAP